MKWNENCSSLSQSLNNPRKIKTQLFDVWTLKRKFLFEYFYLTKILAERFFEVFAPKLYLFLIEVKGEKRQNQHRYKKKLFVHQHQLR